MSQASQKLRTPVVSPTTGELIIPPTEPGSREGAFGKTYRESTQKVIDDTTKELTSKLAWAVGTTYSMPYTGRTSLVRRYVTKCVTAILRDHGFPEI